MATPCKIGISVLLCTFNGSKQIAETLRCLTLQQMHQEIPWEIILVDNASNDGTTDVAQRVWRGLSTVVPLHIIQEPKPGKQYALQAAVAKAKYRYTCIVDDDNRLSSNYLSVGLKILESNSKIGILGGPSSATFDGKEPHWFSDFQHCYAVGPQLNRINATSKPLTDGSIGRNVLWGAGMFVRTALWYELRVVSFQSLFIGRELNKQSKNSLTGGEDDELCYAAQLLGYEVWYSTKLHLQHHMAANRLTQDYRDQLFRSSARTTARLNAYRNALWGKQDSFLTINLLKDLSYLILSFLKQIVMVLFSKSNKDKYILRMERKHALVAIGNVLSNLRQARSQYEQVLNLRKKINAIFHTRSLKY